MGSKDLGGKDSAMFFEICYLRSGEGHRQGVCCGIAFERGGSFETGSAFRPKNRQNWALRLSMKEYAIALRLP